LKLVFGIHNHQPVGNFDHVIAEVYRRSYEPFLARLEAHPNIRLCMHHTGPLWEWLEANQPRYLDRIAALVKAGRVEILGGAFYEPILPMIPAVDRLGQIQLMTEKVQERFGTRTRGMWLAERVWEPQLTDSLARAGVEFVLLDDFHFIQSGLSAEELTTGPLLTEELGATVALLPISERLRYLIPFREPAETVDLCRRLHERDPGGLLVMVDDGEKFGGWPDTYEWVYERGWLDRFFAALEREADWLQLATPSEALDARPPRRRVYIPPCSYFEMTEWAMLVPAAERFHVVVEEAKRQDRFEALRPFLRGALWRQFLQRYTESAIMYQRSLLLHADIARAAADAPASAVARRELWQAQCNCAYWHGVFGGLYLPHLRHAVYEHLIKGTAALPATAAAGGVQAVSLSAAATWDLRLRNNDLDLFLSPSRGAACVGLEVRRPAWNLQNTLRRRREAYHGKIEGRPPETAAGKADHDSIHDRAYAVSPELREALAVDPQHRFSWLDRLLHPEATPTDCLAGMAAADGGDFAEASYELITPNRSLTKEGRGPVGWLAAGPLQVVCRRRGLYRDRRGRTTPLNLTKTVTLEEASPRVRVTWRLRNEGARQAVLRFGSEWNLALLQQETYLDTAGAATARLGAGSLGRREALSVWLPPLKLAMAWRFSPSCELWIQEVPTISQSESAFELQYQGHWILPLWDVTLASGQECEFDLTFTVGERQE
jgi:alpha-amylase/alpha-mannosidase (GH57 family)